MSKTLSAILTGTIVTLIIVSAYLLTTNVYSDTRDARDRETTGRTVEPTPDSPPAVSPPTEATPPSGGITSSTSGTASTGGNSGGQVTTGDEHVEVFEINIGPSNPPATPDDDDEDTPPTTDPTCGGGGRTRTDCPQDNTRSR